MVPHDVMQQHINHELMYDEMVNTPILLIVKPVRFELIVIARGTINLIDLIDFWPDKDASTLIIIFASPSWKIE